MLFDWELLHVLGDCRTAHHGRDNVGNVAEDSLTLALNRSKFEPLRALQETLQEPFPFSRVS